MEEQPVTIVEDEKAVSDSKGKQEAASAQPSLEKSFLERTGELLRNLKCIEGFKTHDGLRQFQVVVETTSKREGRQRENLENALNKVFRDFYDDYAEDIKNGKLGFLSESKTMLTIGSSGKANIPLSEIYISVETENQDMLDTVEASIFFIMQHVCPEEDLPAVITICSEFESDKPATGNFMDMVGSIIGRVTDRLDGAVAKGLEGEDGKINTNAVGGVVGDLMNDDVIQKSMQDMLASVTGADFNINEVFSNLMGSVPGAKK